MRNWNGMAIKQNPPGTAYGLMVLETIFLTRKTYYEYKNNPRPEAIESPQNK